MTEPIDPPNPDGVTDRTINPTAVKEAIMDKETEAEAGAHEVESEHPTSSDVGKQTLTKADMGGRDVTKEGVPDEGEALATPRHPDDPSGETE
jgi:hypothetical protein